MQRNTPPDTLLIPVSAGELLDKKVILQIKSERFTNEAQLANVRYELELLTAIAAPLLSEPVAALEAELKAINSKMWDLENAVREHDRSGSFGDSFVATARQTYANNDKRSALKRQINLLLRSAIVEEKSHR